MTGKSGHPTPTWQPPNDEQLSRRLEAAELRERPASAFAFPPAAQRAAKLGQPYRKALRRFDQVTDASDADRAPAFENIRCAASYFHVGMTEKSWHDLMH